MSFNYTKLYDDPEIDKHIIAASEKYNNDMEKMLGIGLNMPFECTNSASRKNMFSSQYQQKVCLEEPEIPYLSTGYENLFGKRSSSFIKSDRHWRVIGKIEKFSNLPGHHYFLFIIDENNNLDVIERVSYSHNTESYGFLYNNDYLDKLEVGSDIQPNSTIKKSKSFDTADNYMTGKNLRVSYVASSTTTEDAIEISESASMALARPEIKKVTILINDNDIPLNLYGDDSTYKIIPDIGEEIKNGIVCGIRTERNDELFFTQSKERLKIPMINDTTFKTKGRVIDINVYCNKDISTSTNGIYEGQLDYYDKDNKRFCSEVVELLRDFIDNSMYNKSYELCHLYTTCEKIINGKQYFKDNAFSNIIIELTVYRKAPLEVGDKVTSRYGGKGVISKINKDDKMPRISGTDEVIDLIWNQATCVNRLNPGQLFELSLNFISNNIAKYILTFAQDVDMCVETMSDFFNILSSDWAQFFRSEMESCINDDEAIFTLYDWLTEHGDGLYLPLEPISESITFDTLIELYQKFPWIKPVFTDVPTLDSRGRTRFVQSKKPSIIARQYIYRMKQNAEEKHSATAMSATNVRCLNSKSKAAKLFIRVHPNTPIRFGEMETGIFGEMGAEIQVKILMLYSTSPQGRRDAAQMLENYELNVELSEDAKSRSAEMVNAIIKCMGHKFVFKKIPIKYKEIGHVADDSALFHFFDCYDNHLIIPAGTNEAKLFINADNNPNYQALFSIAGENHNKLFVEGNC